MSTGNRIGPRARRVYQAGVTERIRQLVNEAGGQTEFARRIWGDPLPHKGKVGKWYNGRSGIHPTLASVVAKAFGRRPAWLLLGELPEREGAVLAEAKLADELATYLRQEVASRKGVDPSDVFVDVANLLPSLAERLVPTSRLVAVRPTALNRAGLREPTPLVYIK